MRWWSTPAAASGAQVISSVFDFVAASWFRLTSCNCVFAQAVLALLKEVVEYASGAAVHPSSLPALEHVASLVTPLAAADNFDEDAWDKVHSGFCKLVVTSSALSTVPKGMAPALSR